MPDDDMVPTLPVSLTSQLASPVGVNFHPTAALQLTLTQRQLNNMEQQSNNHGTTMAHVQFEGIVGQMNQVWRRLNGWTH